MRFHCIDIDIADYDQRGIVGPVIARVEIAQALGRSGINVLDRTIGAKPRRKACVWCDEFEVILDPADLEIVARPGFRLDNATFAVHRVSGDGQLAGGFAHQHQRGAQQIVVIAWQVELVDRLLEPGRGVGIRPERKTLAFEKFDHLAFGDVGRSVEGHVFDEMGESQFVVFFIDPSHIDAEPHDDGILRRFVVHDGIAHAVFEDPVSNRSVGCDIVNRQPPGGFVALSRLNPCCIALLRHDRRGKSD